MITIPLLYFILNIVTGCMSLSLSILLLVFRGPDIFKPASLLMFLFWFWLISELAEYFTNDPDLKFFFNNLQFIATSILPVVWISFCYHIRMGHSLFRKRIYLLLLIYPGTILLLVYTNTFHHLLGSAPQYRFGDYEIIRELNSLSTMMLLSTFFVIFLGISMLVFKPNEALKKGGKSRWVIVFMGLLTMGTAFLEWRNKYSHHFEITPLTVSLVGLSALLYLKNSIRSQVLLNRYNILSNLKEPLFLIKEDGLVLFANNSAVKLSGIDEAQFYSVNIKSVIPPLQNLKDGVIFHKHLFFSVNINPVLREKDKILAVSLTEITALKDSEISLKNLTDELENQVKNRTDRLNLTNLKLEKLLEEKNILLQEVHHRVNNNLQLIISLLNLQSSRVEEDQIKEYLKDAVTRVQTIAMVHQMLYKSEDFTRINLKLYLDDLLLSMLKEHQEDLQRDFCDIICSTTTCIQVGMILNEIVLNALKYAYSLEEEHKRFFCKSFVEKRKEDADRLHIVFRDYGKGIPESILNSHDEKSLGFRIIRTLVEQRNGEIKIHNDMGCVYDLFVEL